MKKALLIIGVPAALFAIFFWVYFPTLTRYRELKTEQDQIEEKIAELDQKILELQEERHLLETNREYIEKVIRDELGLVKPGEVVYKFVEEKAKEEVPAEISSKTDTPPAE